MTGNAEALSAKFTKLIRKQLKGTDQRKALCSIQHSFAGPSALPFGLVHGKIWGQI
jgi:hypothetical protein